MAATSGKRRASVIDAASSTASGRASARRGVRAQSMLLAAIVTGVLFGALACAAGMASANGHGAIMSHLESNGVDTSTVFSAERSHFEDGDDADGIGRLVAAAPGPPSSPRLTHDKDRRPPADPGQCHPSMACVVTIDLRFPDLTMVSEAHATDAAPAASPADGAPELEPPIP